MTEYVELHCHSHFSLLDGASSPDELAARAAALGMPALALTDHDALYSVIPFIKASHQHGITPIVGAELTLESGHHLTLLVENQTGWQNLCSLITHARLNAPKGEAGLPKAVLLEHTDGLMAFSGCRKGEIAQALLAREKSQAVALAQEYKGRFQRFFVELQHHLLPEDNRLVAELSDLAAYVKSPLVVSNNVHYATPDAQSLQDVLVSIRHNRSLDEAGSFQRPNGEYFLKSVRELTPLFPHQHKALENTYRIAERCTYLPSYGVQDLPAFPTPEGISAEEYLAYLCWQAIPKRYGDAPERVTRQLQHELAVIERCQLANYFLIVWDIVRYAQSNGIRCQGRGSAANSLVAYLLSVTPVDPIQYDLVFERFLSDERAVTPDIDIDFDAERREEVIQYVYTRYGRDHAAMACTFVTFRRKSSLRDVGKALGLLPDTLDYLVSLNDLSDDARLEADGLSPKTLHHLMELSEQIHHFPRHLGIHNGGMVVSGAPLAHRLPLEPATMSDRTVVQWDKEGLEEAGIIKIDILGLRMLTAISDTLKEIERTTGKCIDLDRLPFDDPSIYRMISSGDTVGIFQVESRAQAQMLPRMKPQNFADLIIAISLIRPGPIQGDMVHPYLRRRLGREAVTYYHPLLIPALKETLGVILFQEQVIKIARDLAGFTAGQGEQLRRALGVKDAEEAIETFRGIFAAGAAQNAVPADIAELVFDRMCAFGGYSFPKSHGASFADIVRRSAYLKYHYPAAFTTAILNNQPMGFWSPAVIVNDAKRHGIPLFSIDVNHSDALCRVEGKGIRMGLNYTKGIGKEMAERVTATRGDRPFQSLNDFYRRTRLPQRLIENLILCGAFDYLGKPRRDLLWTLGGLSTAPDELPLLFPEEAVAFTPPSRGETLQTEFRLTGVSLHEHPMEMYRPHFKKRGILGSKAVEKVPAGTTVIVAGLNVVHQSPPTAKGFHFITLEDEHDFLNIIVRPHIYARFRHVIRRVPILVVRGTIERDGDVTNIMAVSVSSVKDD